MTSKICIEILNARAESLFSSLNHVFVYFSFDVLVALADVHIDCFAHKAYCFITECLFPHSFEMTVFALNKLPLRTFP